MFVLYCSSILFILPLALTLWNCIDDAFFKKFYKIRSCYRSNGVIIAQANYYNISECLEFGRERKGLAVNFSPPEASKNYGEFFKTCQVLACPEIGNMTTLVKDASYDYYSLYGNLNETEQSSCVKSTGLFRIIQEKQNYTSAILKCQDMGGDLADILSELRTNGLSTLVNYEISDWYKAAYVGLDDMRKEGLFETPYGSPINCFKFRAWSPGHPRSKRKNHDCVVIDNEKSWKVVNCKYKLPFICEIYSQKPTDTTEGKYSNINCDTLESETQKINCLEEKEMLEVLKNSTRSDQCSLIYSIYE